LTVPTPARRQAFVVFAAISAGYIASQFYRASPAVIAPELMRDLSLSAGAVGGVAGMFFLAFGVSQLPVGVLLDRFGPRRSMAALLGVAVLGALVFAAADSGATLAAGRMLMGLGCAAGLMGAMVVLARWFPPESFATMSGFVMGIGSTGVLLAATPLAMAADGIGWRGAFLVAAAVTALLALLLYAAVRDAPPDHPHNTRTREGLREIAQGLRVVLADRRMWRICAMQLSIYPGVMTVAGLWAGPYLYDVHALDTAARGRLLNLVYVALAVSPILAGPLDRIFNTRKWLVVGASLGLAVVYGLLAVVPGLALWQAVTLFTLMGALSPGSLVAHAHARSILPEHLVGRGMTLQNTAGIGGVFILQGATGLIIGALTQAAGPAPELAYRAAFGFLGLMLLVSLVAYLPIPDVRPGERAEASGASDRRRI